jgi:hypothetical protein
MKKEVVHQKQFEILSLFGSIDFDPQYDYKAARRRTREVLEPVDASVSKVVFRTTNKPFGRKP